MTLKEFSVKAMPNSPYDLTRMHVLTGIHDLTGILAYDDIFRKNHAPLYQICVVLEQMFRNLPYQEPNDGMFFQRFIPKWGSNCTIRYSVVSCDLQPHGCDCQSEKDEGQRDFDLGYDQPSATCAEPVCSIS